MDQKKLLAEEIEHLCEKLERNERSGGGAVSPLGGVLTEAARDVTARLRDERSDDITEPALAFWEADEKTDPTNEEAITAVAKRILRILHAGVKRGD